MLETILIGVAGVLLLFVAVVATRPSGYHVERKREVAAPADVIFGVLNDLHRFAGVFVLFGSTQEQSDPHIQKTFTGPPAGVGQSYAWKGNKDVGQGKMTIEESVPGEKVGVQLEFVKPMASKATCALTLQGTATGSLVTWSMDGNHNFLGKAFGLFLDMDKLLGNDIEKGLAVLESVAEGKRAPAARADADGAALAVAPAPLGGKPE